MNEINLNLQKKLDETREQYQKQIGDYAKQSVKRNSSRKTLFKIL